MGNLDAPSLSGKLGQRRSRFGGCFITVAIVLSLFLIVVAWKYLRDPWLEVVPSDQTMAGVWGIDPDLTTGDEARSLLRSNDLRPQDGWLELKPDRRFAIQGMPKFWEHPITSPGMLSSASGSWRLEQDSNGWVMVNLYFERNGDKSANEWDWGHSFIRAKGSDYFLYFIRDFDSSDFLVLKRKSQ